MKNNKWGPLSSQYRDAAMYDDLLEMDPPMRVLYLGYTSFAWRCWSEQYKNADDVTKRTILYTVAVALQSEGL